MVTNRPPPLLQHRAIASRRVLTVPNMLFLLESEGSERSGADSASSGTDCSNFQSPASFFESHGSKVPKSNVQGEASRNAPPLSSHPCKLPQSLQVPKERQLPKLLLSHPPCFFLSPLPPSPHQRFCLFLSNTPGCLFLLRGCIKALRIPGCFDTSPPSLRAEILERGL